MSKSDVPLAPRKPQSPEPVDDEFIPSLGKGLAVLELFSAKSPELTLTQIAKTLQLSPGSTRRILRTLEQLGYAVSDEGRFSLTPRVLNLGFSYLSSQPLAKTAQPLLTQLARQLQATCCIVVLDGREVVYIARGVHRHIESFVVHVGARLPAYATAPGKVLLAGLAEADFESLVDGWKLEAFTPNTVSTVEQLRAEVAVIRQRGYAINDQEIFLGQRSIAVPLSLGGFQSAALVAATSVSSVTVSQLEDELLGPLHGAVAEIEGMVASLL